MIHISLLASLFQCRICNAVSDQIINIWSHLCHSKYDGSKVLWSDETKLNILVRYSVSIFAFETCISRRRLLPMMFWAVSIPKVTGVMHVTSYRAVLADNLVASTTRLRPICMWTFLKDGPNHTSKYIQMVLWQQNLCSAMVISSTGSQSYQKLVSWNWRGQLISANPRMWRLLQGSAQRAQNPMLLSLPEVDAPSTKPGVWIIVE